MCTKNELQIIVSEIAKTAKQTFKDNLDSVILYGSYARGDYTSDSDVDIMILVKGIAPQDLWRYRAPITEKSSQLGLEYDILITPLIKDTDTFNKYLDVLPFYQNVDKEGLRIGALIQSCIIQTQIGSSP